MSFSCAATSVRGYSPATRTLLGTSLALALVAICRGEAPTMLPPPGLYLDAQFVRARDADTIEWKVPGSAFVFASRLIDVWAPETDGGDQFTRALAARGKAFATEQCLHAKRFAVYIPLPKGSQPLKSLTFDRIPSYIYLDEKTLLNTILVSQGFASSKKGGQIGE